MTVKYIAFDGKEFDNEEKCKEYEKGNSKKIRAEIGNVRHALKTLDDFCDFWFGSVPGASCKNCPITNLCENVKAEFFENLFNKENPFGNIDYEGDVIEED